MKQFLLTAGIAILCLPALLIAQKPTEANLRKLDTLCRDGKFDDALQLATTWNHPFWIANASQGKGFLVLSKCNDTKLDSATRRQAFMDGVKQLQGVVALCDGYLDKRSANPYLLQHIKAVKGVALFNLGHRAAFLYEKNYGRADSLWEVSLSMFASIDTSKNLAKNREEPTLERDRLVNKVGDGTNLVRTNLGKVFQSVGMYSYAIAEFQTCQGVCKKYYPLDTMHWIRRLGWSYQNLAEVYLEIGNAPEAYQQMVQCAAIKHKFFLLNKSRITDDYINGINTLARAALENNQLEEALKLIQTSDSLLVQADPKMSDVKQKPLKIAEIWSLRGRCAMKSNQWAQAKQHLSESLKHIEALPSPNDESNKLKRDVLRLLRDNAYATGDFRSAAQFQRQYDALLTNAINLNPETKLKFYADKLNRQKSELGLANAKLSEQTDTLQSRNWLLGMLAAVVFIIAGFFIGFLVRYFKKRNELTEVKNTMLLSIYHDLRNPSGKIRAEAKEALAADDPKWQEQKLSAIIGAAGYLENLAETLLQYEKEKVSYAIDTHRLNECCNDAIRQIQSAKGAAIQIANNIPAEAYASFDENHLMRVFMNLISNAIKSINARNQSNPGARIDGCIEINFQSLPGGLVQIEVHDNGIGILSSANDLYMLRQSTGVGLKYCNTVLKAHGGTLQLESSTVLDGACASFTLPGAIQQVIGNDDQPVSTKHIQLSATDIQFLRERLTTIQGIPFYQYSTLKHHLTALGEKAPPAAKKTIQELIEHLDNQRENSFRQAVQNITNTTGKAA